MVASALAAQDQRVHYHRQANEGLAAARNAGLALGRGTYVQFLDADDLIAPSKLSRQVRLMEIDPYLGVSYSNFWRFDGTTGRRIDRTPRRLGTKPIEDFLFTWERGLTIPIHAALFKRTLWPEGRAFDTQVGGREDWLMWIDLALRGVEIAHVDADLAWYRIHASNMVNNRVQMLTWLLEAAQLIRGRIPAEYRRLFIDETVNFAALTARSLLEENGQPAKARGLEMLVAELEINARQAARSGALPDPDARDLVIDQLRLIAFACRRQGLLELTNRCAAAIASLGFVGPEAERNPMLAASIQADRSAMSGQVREAFSVPVRVRNDSDLTMRDARTPGSRFHIMS